MMTCSLCLAGVAWLDEAVVCKEVEEDVGSEVGGKWGKECKEECPK